MKEKNCPRQLASPVPRFLSHRFNGIEQPRKVRALHQCTPSSPSPTLGATDSGAKVEPMEKTLFDDLSARINEALRNSPAQDIEKNLRALLAGWFDRMDVVLREDFEVQRKLLEQAQAKLAALEKRVGELEQAKK